MVYACWDQVTGAEGYIVYGIIKARTLKATTSYTWSLNQKTAKVELSWPAVTGATGYEVQYKKEGGSWTTAGTTDTASLIYQQPYNVYCYYRIRAVYEYFGGVTYGPYYENTYRYIIHYKQ